MIHSYSHKMLMILRFLCSIMNDNCMTVLYFGSSLFLRTQVCREEIYRNTPNQEFVIVTAPGIRAIDSDPFVHGYCSHDSFGISHIGNERIECSADHFQ